MKCVRQTIGTLLVLMLGGCAGALNWSGPPPGATPSSVTVPVTEAIPAHYRVQTGDTLYSIAWRYGLDYHDVADWNGIGSDYLIKPGQVLRLSTPAGRHSNTAATTSSSAPLAPAGKAQASSGSVQGWQWPVDGRVIRQFHAGDPLSKGIDISAARGTAVRAAAGGKVVYAGSGIIGYGKLIIIKHNDAFLSAYADNDTMLVQEGDVVQAGDRIASVGLGRDGRPLLHFEIRYRGKPVDPLKYLPQSH